jgi:anhydro-N-acetylmuramic acid kinase
MSLKRALNKRTLVILGLNSGTSADGLDMAAVRTSRTKRGTAVKYLAGRAKPYPSELRELVLKVADSKTIDLNAVIHLDSLLGQFFGRAALAYIRELGKNNIRVDAVASHGQTIRHLPHKVQFGRFSVAGTLQLGAPERIATATGKMVVADFRQADVAAGNEGAPITAAAMQRLFTTSTESRLIVNIGGIANYFYFPKEKSRLKPSAADCGPGNSLSDILSQRLYGEKFDRKGVRASKGRASERLLTLLLANPFFSGKTISTGRENFGVTVVREILDFGQRFDLTPEDMLATASEFTSAAIAMKIKPVLRHDKKLSKLYLTGGGRKNNFFVNRLKHRLPEMEIHRADELGINADFIEAAAYAVMGEACLRSEPLNLQRKNRTGSTSPVLGRIVQPPVNRRR